MEWNGMECNGMEWFQLRSKTSVFQHLRGMEWNGMEWNRIESNLI